MPKIAELREIDGAMWARIDADLKESGAVSLLTESEVEAIKKSQRSLCAYIAREQISEATDWDTSYWNQACERIALEIERQR